MIGPLLIAVGSLVLVGAICWLLADSRRGRRRATRRRPAPGPAAPLCTKPPLPRRRGRSKLSPAAVDAAFADLASTELADVEEHMALMLPPAIDTEENR